MVEELGKAYSTEKPGRTGKCLSLRHHVSGEYPFHLSCRAAEMRSQIFFSHLILGIYSMEVSSSTDLI